MSDPFYDHQPGPERREKLNELHAMWAGAMANTKGWSPLIRGESDGDRRVLYVYGWTGGIGTQPETRGYIGTTGLVATKAQAMDVRGLQGLPGAGGDLMQVLAGLDTSQAVVVMPTDTLIRAIGNLQAQLLQMLMAGSAPNQVAVNQMLGAQAFADVVGATQVTRHARDSQPGDVWHEYVSDTQLIKKFHGFDNVIRTITETYA